MSMILPLAGPIILNRAEEGRVLEVAIYMLLTFILLPALFILWLTYVLKRFAKHQKSPQLLKINIIATVIYIVIYVTASPLIVLLFGKLQFN